VYYPISWLGVLCALTSTIAGASWKDI
jgi:hypothetical protein